MVVQYQTMEATMPSFKITITKDVELSFINDVMTNAVEGGYCSVRYWGDITDVRRDADLNVLGFRVSPTEETDGDFQPTTLKAEDFIAALTSIALGRMSVNSEHVRAITAGIMEEDAGEIDALDCDVIVQAAVLGEIIYG